MGKFRCVYDYTAQSFLGIVAVVRNNLVPHTLYIDSTCINVKKYIHSSYRLIKILFFKFIISIDPFHADINLLFITRRVSLKNVLNEEILFLELKPSLLHILFFCSILFYFYAYYLIILLKIIMH